LGIGATRVEERMFAALGLGSGSQVCFEPCQSLEYGGVLFLIPFLLANGLLSYKKHYSQRDGGYYNFDQALLTFALMLLCRIKTLEQLKHIQPGEFGKLMGLDRSPEAKCLRGMFKELFLQKKAEQWGVNLAEDWINDEQPGIYYIDGHLLAYHGHLANLGKKHSSRQRLCVPGMMEFWVNNAQGMPYFFVTGQVNEKLQQAIEERIVPQLNVLSQNTIQNKAHFTNENEPAYTLVFDREAYSPAFFAKLWILYHVAVITYNKNVKDKWDENDFDDFETITDIGTVKMKLKEKHFEVNGVKMREIRKLTSSGHQTSIITSNPVLSTNLIAIYMFARWTQENFFRYMRQEYGIDKIMEYGVDEIDNNVKVVNREYSNLTYLLKKIREKIARRKAILFQLIEENINTPLEDTGKSIRKQLKIKEELNSLAEEEGEAIAQRKKIPYYISIAQMPDDTRYNKLKTESKHLQNIVKMICYRADTAFANILAPYYNKSNDEIRALVKSIIFCKADLEPDYINNTLSVTLYSLATPRDNHAVKNTCELLNDTETEFPRTNLRLIYKSATI